MKKNRGFTLIELLIVISIVGILASVILVSLSKARLKAHDANRLAQLKSIASALEVHRSSGDVYPSSDGDGCGGWDVGNADNAFLGNLTDTDAPEDESMTGNCLGYRYYRYPAGSYGCDVNKGAYYVLGATNFESSSRPVSNSPGWSCSGRDWQDEMDWVTGKFENE